MREIKEDTVAIVIPLYKYRPSEDDQVSLNQCFSMLSSYEIIAVKPVGLDIDKYLFPFDRIVEFETKYFEGIKGYNELLMSRIFYEQFLGYEYILIHQTDAFVFSDQLKNWCNKGYDYIGAPWFYKEYPDFVKALKEKTIGWYHRRFNIKQKVTGYPTDRQMINRVGNGGFSLRRVKKFYNLCLSERKLILRYVNETEHYFNEDIFWSIEVNRKQRNLKIPDFRKALNFSIENCPEIAIKYISIDLPFGCHAWNKHRDFWFPIFKRYGYNIS